MEPALPSLQLMSAMPTDPVRAKKAVPVLQHRSGKVENGLPTNFSISILQK